MLAEIEDAIIDRCRELVGSHVKEITDLPGNWDDQTLKAARRAVPGIYVAWSGGRGENNTRAALTSRYAIYVVTGQASGERTRRRGSNRQVGAYEILEQIVPGLHGMSVTGLGSLRLVQVDNLYSDRADQQGIVIYGAVFEVKAIFPAPRATDDLADFEIFHTTSKVPDGPDTEGRHVFTNGSEATP